MMLSNERLGRFTASRIADLFLGPNGGKAKREKYIFEKAEEVVKGHAKPQISNKYTNHGQFNEYEAIQVFGEATGFNVDYLNQKYYPINENCGATPDAAKVDFSDNFLASVDVKCPIETFFIQKMMMINEAKPEYQNVPKDYYYQAQMQMMALKVDTHYLVRYLTKMDMDDDGNKVEYDLPLEVRLFFKEIKADPAVQKQILLEVDKASEERDLLVKIFKSPIL